MKVFHTALLFAGVACSGCVAAQDRPIAVDEGFALPADSIDRMRHSAAGGDANAAFRLSLHYSSGVAQSPEDERFWRQVAAENGHKVAQYNIYMRDHQSADTFTRERALFWLKKSADAGYENAKKILEQN